MLFSFLSCFVFLVQGFDYPLTDPDRYILTFSGDTLGLEEASAFLAPFGATLHKHLALINGAAVTIPRENLAALRDHALVHWHWLFHFSTYQLCNLCSGRYFRA